MFMPKKTNHMKQGLATLGLLCLSATQLSHAQPAELSEQIDPINYGEYIKMVQYEMMRPSVNYCVTKVPALKKDLLTEFDLFKDKVRLAMEPLAAKIGADAMSTPTPSDYNAKANFKALGDAMIAEVKKLEPKMYCNFLVNSMRKTTADSLRQTIETQYARYEQKTKDAKESKESKETKDTKATPDK
jgi:hypothetical protein